jgi:tetratricopeptide (TPR) repeat protein
MPPLSVPRVAQPFLVVLFLLLTSTPAMPKDAWIEVHSPNFIVISNAGEREARKVADQFEQFREVLHLSLNNIRVDLGKPLIIFAVKNEDSLKLLLPAYWEVKGHAHPSGIYVSGEDRHFVALRTNMEGDNPYQVIYHEYTHAIMELNYHGLSLWMSEGLAEFFGNSTIADKCVEIGRASRYHVDELRHSHLIPMDTLLAADQHSPYYNEENRVSMFYAESWVLVHYLMFDPEAKKRQLLANFLNTWSAGEDQLQAAQSAFGDLKNFSKIMEAYASQTSFFEGKINTPIHGDPKSYTSRDLPPAELAADRALFYIHTQRAKEATASIDEALQANRNLSLAYEARGLLAYLQGDLPHAQAAFSRAIALPSPGFSAYYFYGTSGVRGGIPSPEERAKIIAAFDQSIALNPQFSPAYAALSSLCSMTPDTYQKAVDAALKAAKLEPANFRYAINLAYVLLHVGRTSEATTLAVRIQKAARSSGDRAGASDLLAAIATRDAYDRQVAELTERQKQAAADAPAHSAPASTTTVTVVESKSRGGASAANSPRHANETEYEVEGTIAAADCNAASAGALSLTVNHAAMKFTYSSLKDVYVVSDAPQDAKAAPACAAWKDRRVRLYFYKSKNKPYAGEIDTLQFF